MTVDDTSSVIAFGGDRIGVMWSDQTATANGMYFSVHRDGDPDQTWDTSRAAIQVRAVPTTHEPEIRPGRYVQRPGDGRLDEPHVARVEECPSRATGLLDETSRAVHMFMTFPAPPDCLQLVGRRDP